MVKHTKTIQRSTTTGLEKLGVLVNEKSCSSKQVQENVVRLVIFAPFDVTK